jgi:hypothetical protein
MSNKFGVKNEGLAEIINEQREVSRRLLANAIDVKTANAISSSSGKQISAKALDLRERLFAPRLNEIERPVEAAAA